ncbi:MAG: glycosyltransferase [Pseudomonadales bacterium]|nr:glycosyltransferase [Pseudomonadales bacterium]
MNTRAKYRAIWLRLRIHLHALRSAPWAYLTATWWQLRGKRVRSRAQFAALLAVSPLAYRLWLLRETAPAQTNAAGPPLIALIDVAGGQTPDATLRSLVSEGIAAIVVGTPQIPTPAHACPCIDWRDNPWILPLVAGDILARGAAATYRNAGQRTAARLIYADDDLQDQHGQRHTPHFKPQWNEELFRHFDYLGGACIVKTSAQTLAAVSGPDWATRLVNTVLAQGSEVLHIPNVLHHRRVRPLPRIPALPAASEGLPLVSVIVPTRNRLDLLRTCLEGLSRTDYPAMEIIIVDNDSDDAATLAYLAALDPARHRVLRVAEPFNFSTLNNRAVACARGQLLCLLNNDIEILAPLWLRIMAQQALRDEVGAVGACLLYPDGRIQHAGVVLGIGGAAAHAHRLLYPNQEGYFSRHALPQFISAVTAACLVVQRERFEAVGGFDEQNFAVAFNDVDLCLRLNARGWQSFYEPRATLIHKESTSRGRDRDSISAARFDAELAALRKRWGTQETADPFHHPQLSQLSERFGVRI